MKTKRSKLEFEKKYDYLICNGKYYECAFKDGKPTFKEVDKKKIDKRVEQAKKIAERLKEDFDTVAVLTERLMQLEDKSLDTLFKLLFNSKRKYKPKTREGHCVDMKIGRFILPIVD